MLTGIGLYRPAILIKPWLCSFIRLHNVHSLLTSMEKQAASLWKSTHAGGGKTVQSSERESLVKGLNQPGREHLLPAPTVPFVSQRKKEMSREVHIHNISRRLCVGTKIKIDERCVLEVWGTLAAISRLMSGKRSS
jgi:hypothetical protein